LTGGKLETTGNVKQILITYVRMKNEVGDKILLVKKDGILRKTESRWVNKPWTIVSVHMNGTIRVTRGKKSERLNIRRVKPCFEDD
jgi:hypothetical protein